jgi:transcriptional regulator with XRE-family HTH domain
MTKLQQIFADNLKSYRRKKQLSQAALAEKIGSVSTYISQIECGKRFPSPRMIEKLAVILEVEEYELFQPQKLDQENKMDLYFNLRKEINMAIDVSFRNF